ncbi:hypothetical protein [Polyangium sp. 15x6]|uniref:hypothetical protein n=1 Tax=Polyangium sp. 15x6 TaxID=3042687 RepID=UPI00249ADCC8|nr:hypothetical protein [Polyangium sp. 15x6]MDI3282252.1 hypothetical protein [Polyangium sp. 15x6]
MLLCPPGAAGSIIRMDLIDSSMPSWVVGRHVVRLERPDLVSVAFRGATSAAEAEQIRDVYIAIGKQVGKFDILFDASDLVFLEAGARAAWTRGGKVYPLRHVVCFGASFPTRTVIMTVYRAGRLLVPSVFDFHIEFAATEQEARTRLAALGSQAGYACASA